MHPAFHGEAPVLCIAGQGPLDEAAVIMLAQLLTKHGLGVRVEGAEALSTQNISCLETDGIALACLCYLDGGGPAHMRYAVRRLRRKLSEVEIVLGCLTGTAGSTAELMRDAAKADHVGTSLRDIVQLCLEAAKASTPVQEPATIPFPKLAAT